MNTWKVILATVVIFGAGVITGGLLVKNSMPSRVVHRPARPPQLFTSGGMRLDFLRRAQQDLNLTQEQRAAIDDILKRSQERSRKIMQPVAPKLREEIQKTREQFRLVLTREQRGEFDNLWKQQQQRPRDKRPPRDRIGSPQMPPANPPATNSDQLP